MKILQVCPDFPPWALGGAPQTFRLLAESWTQGGHEVTVLASRPAARRALGIPGAAYRVLPLELRDVPTSLHETAYFAPLTRPAREELRRFLLEQAPKFDAIFVQGLLETLPREFLRGFRPANPERLVSLQYGVASADGKRLLGPAARLAYRTWGRTIQSRLRRVVVFSAETEREWREYFGSGRTTDVVRMPLGIDAAAFSKEWTEFQSGTDRLARWRADRALPEHYLFAVGRQDPAKGFDTAIQAFGRLAAELPGWGLVLAGDRTPFSSELARLALDAGCADRVQIGDRVTEWERMALLSGCERFLIPSRKEGYGLNAVLARVLGKSSIATRTGAHEEILGHDPRFELVPPDDPVAFAEGIRRSLRSPAAPMALDRRALDEYDVTRLADRLLALLPAQGGTSGRAADQT